MKGKDRGMEKKGKERGKGVRLEFWLGIVGEEDEPFLLFHIKL